MANAKVGLIGVGKMGLGFATNMRKAGLDLIVFDPDPNACSAARELGAEVAKLPREIGVGCDVVITSLPSAEAVEGVYLGDDGLLARASGDMVLVDTTTSDPHLSRQIGEEARGRSVRYLEAPVLRDAKAAMAGRVILLIAGEPADHDRCRQVFSTFSEESLQIGEHGDALRVKIINNSVSQGNMLVLSEAYAVATALGIELAKIRQVIEKGHGGSNALTFLSPSLEAGDHRVVFEVDTAEKDLSLFLDLAREAKVPVIHNTAAYSVAAFISGIGAGRESFTRIYGTLVEMSRARRSVAAS